MKILTASHGFKPTLTDKQVSEGFLSLDITVKSGCEIGWFLAPTWELVNDWKSGKIDWPEFSRVYFKMIGRRWDFMLDTKKEYLSDKNLILLCYCNEEKFCHRYLAAEFLVRNANAIYYGEYTIS